jgi:hypothetical protein
VDENDRKIDINDRTLERIYRDSVRLDPVTGQAVQLRLPSIYYDLKRENDQLIHEQEVITGKMEGFRERAQKIRQELPIPAFTGVQRMIEDEGTPLVAPSKPLPEAKTK